MIARVLNRICARPMLICWVIGACILDAFLLTAHPNGVRFIRIASDAQGWLFLVLAVIGATGLGFYVGMFTCWFWIRPLCCKLNGAPFKIGDHVVILAGRLRGTLAEVEDITKGQGGQDVVWLDLGPERRTKFRNIFEEYSLMKINKGEGGAPNSRPPCQLPSSSEIRSPNSLRTPSSGGCG
jgi:hypothetical protein